MYKENHYNYHKNHKMSTNFLNYIINLSSLAASMITIAIWGGNISARVRSIEVDMEKSEDRQTRIEEKLDRMQQENNRLLHEFKDEIIKAIVATN
jgi:hypothetical protein